MASLIYREIDKQLYDRLSILSTNRIRVQATPEEPSLWSLQEDGGLVTIVLARLNAVDDGDNPLDGCSQVAELRFFTHVELKGLRDGEGCYDFIEAIIARLLGFKPSSGGEIAFNSWEFLGAIKQENRYAFRVNFSMNFMLVGLQPDDPATLLKRVRFVNDDNRELANTDDNSFRLGE